VFLSPMLLMQADVPFDDDRYIYEPKIDGHRLIHSLENGKSALYTRSNQDITKQYPELHCVPVIDNSDIVLDGEVACIDPDSGAIDHDLVMERYRMKKWLSIREGVVRQPVHYFVFDILRYKGEDLRNRALTERKSILAEVLSPNAYFSPLPAIDGAGTALFQAIQEKNLEGIVAKRKDSFYVSGRNPDWQQIINYRYIDCPIIGYRKNQFGWLLDDRGHRAGVIEMNVPSAYKKAFQGVAGSIAVGEDKDFVYVKPEIRARIRYRSRMRDGRLRKPEFVDFAL